MMRQTRSLIHSPTLGRRQSLAVGAGREDAQDRPARPIPAGAAADAASRKDAQVRPSRQQSAAAAPLASQVKRTPGKGKDASTRLKAGLVAFWLVLLPGLAHADDTEIYFVGADPKDLQPNILLILDTSTSMRLPVPDYCPYDGSKSPPDCTNPPRCPRGTRSTPDKPCGGPPPPDTKTRLEVMQDAVRAILENAEKVNIGLMRFNGSEGGSVLFPVADIDGELRSFPSEGGAAATITVRERMIELVDELTVTSGTPIVKALHEAARYWTGRGVQYGRYRDDFPTNAGYPDDPAQSGKSRLSHPSSYCTAAGACRGARVNQTSRVRTDAFGVFTPGGCSKNNLNRRPCSGRLIFGAPRYISPLTSACQKSYQVLLSDGGASKFIPPGRNRGRNRTLFPNSIDQNVRNNTSGKFRYPVAVPGDRVISQIRNEFLKRRCSTTDGGGTPYEADAELCAVDLVKALYDNDQNINLDNVQNVTTFTVAFGLGSNQDAQQFLNDIAAAGSGEALTNAQTQRAKGFYTAESAQDLLNVFRTIIDEVVDDSSAFAAPAVATNQFNSLQSRNTIYFGMFTPSVEARWQGNLKRYGVCLDEDPDGDGTDNCAFGDVLDATGARATNAENEFLSTAQSFWSLGPDGASTGSGGAGAALERQGYNARTLYTDATDAVTRAPPPRNTSLDANRHKITASTWGSDPLSYVRSLVCPTPCLSSPCRNSDVDCEKRMNWMLGREADANTTRWSLADVLHSAPAAVTYGGADNDNDGQAETFFDKVFFGTNGGMLHMLNAETGEEEWAFIPQDMLRKQRRLYDNSGSHVYGVDSPPIVRIVDGDNDGNIEPGEGDLVHLYFGNRRGGNHYYALDVTPTTALTSSAPGAITPKFLWRIRGEGASRNAGPATQTLARLGQSWSPPVLATIRTLGGPRDVLIFGGGYDERLDERFRPARGEALGNAVYIVDAATGRLLLSISGTRSGDNVFSVFDRNGRSTANSTRGNDIFVPQMRYSIPARIRVFDSNGDGFENRMYFSDTGGQIFRIDLGRDILPRGGLDSSVTDRTVVGRLANISTPGQPANQRRFFAEPVVVPVQDNVYSDAANGEFDYVLIGSGYAPRPLNRIVRDRFYGFRDRRISKMSDGNGDNLADGYPVRSSALRATTPIGHGNPGDLIGITNSTLEDRRDPNKQEIPDRVKQSSGWFYDFQAEAAPVAGEKVIRGATVNGGILQFSSYQPADLATSDPCSVNVGASRDFNWNILSGRAALDWDGDGKVDASDRVRAGGAGISSGGVPLYTDRGVLILNTTGPGIKSELVVEGVPRYRTYWHDDL